MGCKLISGYQKAKRIFVGNKCSAGEFPIEDSVSAAIRIGLIGMAVKARGLWPGCLFVNCSIAHVIMYLAEAVTCSLLVFQISIS